MSQTRHPHDLDAERAVLGAVLMRNEAYPEVRDRLSDDDFYREAHAEVYRTMEVLHEAGRPLDFITLKDELVRRGRMDEVGVSYLSSLTDGVPRSTNVVGYADVVSDLADRRRLQQVCREGLTEARDAKTAEEAASRLVERTRAAVRVRGDGGETLGSAISDLLAHLDEQSDATTTGLPTLDGMGSGFRPGELTLLAGRPSHGKTALALHLAKAASGAGLPTYFASLEMTKEALTMRWLASDAGVWFSALRSGTLTQTEFAKVSVSVERLSALPITLDDHASLGMGDLRRAMVGSKGGLLIVDYLQLVQPPESTRGQNRTQEVSAISRGLKAIAHDCKVSVLALSQLNRQSETSGTEARLSQLRDSGALEQDADQVWMIWRPVLSQGHDAPDDLALLRVAKHRNGPLGRVELHFDTSRQQFRERTAKDATVPKESSDDSKMKEW